jgi:hypothetical protein
LLQETRPKREKKIELIARNLYLNKLIREKEKKMFFSIRNYKVCVFFLITSELDKDRQERALLGNVPPNLYESNCAPDFNEFLEGPASEDGEAVGVPEPTNGAQGARSTYPNINPGHSAAPEANALGPVSSMIGKNIKKYNYTYFT